MSIPTLSNILLESLSINQLYNLSKKIHISRIEDEIESRLLSSDRNKYIEVIDLLYNKRNEPTVKQWLNSYRVQKGLVGAIPWKIGVVYDYRDQSYRTNKVSIIVGKPTAYMTSKGYFKPSWLESSQTNLTLREVINRTGKSINNTISIVTQNPDLDQNIRELLLNNNTAELTICTFLPAIGTVFNSYDMSLPYGENKQMYPCNIKIGNYEYDLIEYPEDPNIIRQNFIVNISKSPEVKKLIQLRQYLNV